MRTFKKFFKSIPFLALLFTGFAAVGIAQDTTAIDNPEAKTPVILATTPTGGEVNVDPGTVIEITFSSEMNETTINESTLLLHATFSDTSLTMSEKYADMMYDQNGDRSASNDSEKSGKATTEAVNGTISYSNKVAVFTPDMGLREDATYVFIVTNGVKNSEDIALENDHNLSFTTIGTSDSAFSNNQNVKDGMNSNEYHESATDSTLKGTVDMINLGKADQFVILAKTNITNGSESRITGRTGEGFVADSLKKEKDNSDSTRQITTAQTEVLQSYQNDDISVDISEAIEDMMAAYNDASMQSGNDTTRHTMERFQDTELTSGVHEWNDSLHIVSDVTLSGDEDDVWLFKVSGNLNIDEDIEFTLTDGARSDNVFWYVEGGVTIGENAHFEGIVLSMNEITLGKGANLNGRMFSQASISLDDNTVTEPITMGGRTTSINR